MNKRSFLQTFSPVIGAFALAAAALFVLFNPFAAGVRSQNNQTSAASTAKTPARFALLVGINDYKLSKQFPIKNLQGTSNDVALMKNLLVDLYGFKDAKDAQIKTLLGAQATRAAIIREFENYLIANAAQNRDAEIVFYYSGHGSTLADDNADEIDGADETIVPYDSDSQGVNDIRDDQFDEFYRKLKQYTSNIVFIFDSCHSGTVTRGGVSKSVVRSVKAEKTIGTRGGRDENAPRMQPKDGMSGGDAAYVTISGSLPSELSQEDEFTDPETRAAQWNGALTYNLVRQLRLDPDVTYREIIRRIRPAVSKYNQTPQAEGDIDRRVFGSAETRQKTPIFIKNSRKIMKNFGGEEKAVIEADIEAGSLVGAGTNAALLVIGRKANSPVRQKIGSGIVTWADEFKAKAEIALDDAALEKIPEDATATIVSPSFDAKEKFTVALDYKKNTPPQTSAAANEPGAKMLDALETNFKTSNLIATVRKTDVLAVVAKTRTQAAGKTLGADGDWRAAVVRGSYAEFKRGNLQSPISPTLAPAKSETSARGESDPCAGKNRAGTSTGEPSDADEGFFIVNRQGTALYNLWFDVKNENAGKCLAAALEKHARIENLKNLASLGSDLDEQVTARIVRLKNWQVVDRRRPTCRFEPVSDAEIAADNKIVPQFKADETKNIMADADARDMYYVEITNDSSVDLYVYLYSLDTNGAISVLLPQVEGAEAGEQLPAGKSLKTIEKISSGCGAFYVRPPAENPTGVETLKLIATRDSFPPRLLEQPSIVPKGGRKGGFTQLFVQTAGGRRDGTVSFELGDWTAKNLPIEIVR